VARKVFTVSETFTIRGRGVVLLPGLVPIGEERFRIGDSLLLKPPTGEDTHVVIGGLDLCTGPDVPVLLKGLTKDDVPVGTEVWSVDGGAAGR
jgi:hypothetical protein